MASSHGSGSWAFLLLPNKKLSSRVQARDRSCICGVGNQQVNGSTSDEPSRSRFIGSTGDHSDMALVPRANFTSHFLVGPTVTKHQTLETQNSSTQQDPFGGNTAVCVTPSANQTRGTVFASWSSQAYLTFGS